MRAAILKKQAFAFSHAMRMPDNNDRYTPDRTLLNMEYRTMLEHLKDKDGAYYYENVLIPSGKTLKNFIYGG